MINEEIDRYIDPYSMQIAIKKQINRQIKIHTTPPPTHTDTDTHTYTHTQKIYIRAVTVCKIMSFTLPISPLGSGNAHRTHCGESCTFTNKQTLEIQRKRMRSGREIQKVKKKDTSEVQQNIYIQKKKKSMLNVNQRNPT